MKRRFLLGSAALGAAGSTVLAACNADTFSNAFGGGAGSSGELPRVQWRMATSWPLSLDLLYGGAKTLCDRVFAMTGGRFSITPFPAGEIVPGLQVLEAVQAGTVQCGHTASYYSIATSPAFAFGTTIPFGLTAQQQNAWLYRGGGLEAMNQLYATLGVIAFPAGNTGGQMGGWFQREVESVSDLDGLTMRISGLGGSVMASLGVNVQVLPVEEIVSALDRGSLDAAEFVGPYDDEKLGLANVAPFYYYPGWWEPGATLTVQIDLNVWTDLLPEYQEIFKAAAYATNIDMLAKYDAVNGAALQRLANGGTTLKQFNPDIIDAARDATTQLLDDTAAGDAAFKAIYDRWSVFREQVYSWNRINELSYGNIAFGALL
jgi:TRAP-type mannitol/chloroaromatic compound transport system substrate-binding protein